MRSIVIGLFAALVLSLVALWALVDRAVPLPDVMRDRIETAINSGSVGQKVGIGGIDVVVGRDRAARAVFGQAVAD